MVCTISGLRLPVVPTVYKPSHSSIHGVHRNTSLPFFLKNDSFSCNMHSSLLTSLISNLVSIVYILAVACFKSLFGSPFLSFNWAFGEPTLLLSLYVTEWNMKLLLVASLSLGFLEDRLIYYMSALFPIIVPLIGLFVKWTLRSCLHIRWAC